MDYLFQKKAIYCIARLLATLSISTSDLSGNLPPSLHAVNDTDPEVTEM